jgi:hypothetical protein
MIFTQLELLQSQPVDLTKAFNMQTHPGTASKIQEINKRRHDFYTKCSQLVRTDLKQPASDFDWLSMLTYLNDGVDLLELTVKQANYPLNFEYRPVSKGLESVKECQGNLFISY